MTKHGLIDKRTKWVPPTKREKIRYRDLSKYVKEKQLKSKRHDNGFHYDYIYHCPKCGVMVSNTTQHAPDINRNKSVFLFEESISGGIANIYFRCKKCSQVYNFQA